MSGALMSGFTGKVQNDEGAPVKRGNEARYRGNFYCGRNLGTKKIPGSDGRCGPNNGPQCPSCQRFQARESKSIPMTCFLNHELEEDHREMHMCDICGKRGTHFRCTGKCDFDACEECFGRKGSALPKLTKKQKTAIEDSNPVVIASCPSKWRDEIAEICKEYNIEVLAIDAKSQEAKDIAANKSNWYIPPIFNKIKERWKAVWSSWVKEALDVLRSLWDKLTGGGSDTRPVVMIAVKNVQEEKEKEMRKERVACQWERHEIKEMLKGYEPEAFEYIECASIAEMQHILNEIFDDEDDDDSDMTDEEDFEDFAYDMDPDEEWQDEF